MKERLIAHEFRGRSEALLIIVEQIVSAYQDAGLRLTLRQLYYQLVSRNVIPNVERAYKNLSTLVSTARLAGRIDWDAIEDRTRVPVIPPEFSGLDDLVGAALQSYRLPRWEGQDHYVELWVEKDALAGILRPLAHADHVVLMVNRGYSSQSAMYEAANRFRDKADAGQDCVLLYLGDLDPSGEDMVRDIQERFDTFGVDVAVHKVALTMEQVRQFNPPPNPAKHTDPRARGFIARHGATSWEVDALPPEALDRIIRRAVEAVVDRQKMQAVIEQEEKDRVHRTGGEGQSCPPRGRQEHSEMSVQVKRLEVADPQKGNRDAAVNSPTTTMTGDTELAREDFFHQLGIARQRYYKLRAEGRLPEPPRLPGTTIIKWTPRYLKQCQTALARLRAENRRRLGLRAKDLKKAGLI